MTKPIEKSKLYVGQRVKYQAGRHATQHYMSHIRGNMYMRLNGIAQDYITGTILSIDSLLGICFRPDGWPLPENESPQGFCSAVESWIFPINGSTEVPGVLCNGAGAPLTYAQIRAEVQKVPAW